MRSPVCMLNFQGFKYLWHLPYYFFKLLEKSLNPCLVRNSGARSTSSEGTKPMPSGVVFISKRYTFAGGFWLRNGHKFSRKVNERSPRNSDMSPSHGAGLTTTLEKGGPDINEKVAGQSADQSAALSQEAESPVSGLSISAKLSSIKISKSTKLRVKILISLVLFASLFIFGKVDLHKAVEVGLKADKGYLLLAVALSLASTF
ncbi:MAG: hypothetical protein HC888_12870 [Candidatus Competibacteraceae bacterium]|nr:hypothetical protein [Candidatus Competibacteraceae bacterium]